jgi:hypothetical protein
MMRAGYSIAYECAQPTPMVLMLSFDLIPRAWETLATHPPIAARDYRDDFGPGTADVVAPEAEQVSIQDLPDDVLIYLLASRYCDTDHLSNMAWSSFGNGPTGGARVQAICD